MRYVWALVVLAMAAGAYVLPTPEPPGPGPSSGVAEPTVAVCPAEEGSGRTTEISVLSTVDGPTALTLFAGGDTAGSLGTRTGRSGSVAIPVVDVAAVGTVGGLVELPVPSSAAGSVISGAESLAAEACASAPSPATFVTGGSTVSGETFVIQLMNPYAGEAVVELMVQSEAGIESNERFESVIVPASDSAVVDMTELVPGRESLSVSVETSSGRVMAVARQGGGGGTAMWKAVEGAMDWFLPVPAGGDVRQLILATPVNNEIDYQVDFYGSNGLDEGLAGGQLSPRGRVVIDLSEISPETSALRVVATGPVVPTLRLDSGGLAMTTGITEDSTRWLLPGASPPELGWASIVILNPSIEDASVAVRPLRDGSVVRMHTVPADGTLELGIEEADGYLVESTVPVVVLWTAQREASRSVAIGVPLADG